MLIKVVLEVLLTVLEVPLEAPDLPLAVWSQMAYH